MEGQTMLFVCWFLITLVVGYKADPLPKPQKLTWNDANPIVLDLVKLNSTSTGTSILDSAIQRAITSVSSTKFFPYTNESSLQISQGSSSPSLSIQVDNPNVDLQLGVDESYNLTASSTQITINANTIYGALHGITTLQQIIIYEDNKFVIEGALSIIDYPNFPHRGLMIDSGRNYLTVDSILEQIQIMSLSKMNSLHWHISDSQSFPLKLDSYPQLIQGAYSPQEIYTKQDVANIVQFANARGVRVIPEIDMPGHVNAGWVNIDVNITECTNVWYGDAAFEPPAGQLNIMNDKTYQVIANIYKEMSSLFKDHSFHFGLDELQSRCYPSAWFSNGKTLSDLTQSYLDRALPIYNSVPNRKITLWDDVLMSSPGNVQNIPKNITLQVWHDPANIKNLTSRGYNVIASSKNFLYLDCGNSNWSTDDPRYVESSQNSWFNNGLAGSSCGPYKNWQRIFDFDFTAGLSDDQKKLVLGAEAALWSEQVDSTVLTMKLWPRLAALGESTWSGNKDSNGHYKTYDLVQRILNFRERLVKMGFAATPLVPKYCLIHPHGCDQFKNRPIY